jgi:imidazolonepropionase-like amidohydrolase
MRILARSLRALRALLAFMAAILGTRGSSAQIKPPAPPPQVVITNVTLINPATSSVLVDATVVITGDRITSVSRGPSAPGDALAGAIVTAVSQSANAIVINATGLYLVPGLWDMHIHSAFGDWFPRGRDVILPLYVANGVTGVRDMGGDIPVLKQWRAEIAAGEIVGPRIKFSGPMLDALLPSGKLRFPSSIAVTTPASAAAAVDDLKSQGVDFIKFQSVISHEAYLAAAAEARKIGIPAVGHVPDQVRITEAIAAGQKSIEHLMGSFEGCSSEEEKFVTGHGNLKLLLSTTDRKKCDAMIAELVHSQIWECPTLTWQRGGTFLDQRDLKNDPLGKYIPAYWKQVTWKRFTDEMMPDLVKDPLELRREYFARNLQMVSAQHRAGVPFLAGTDSAPGVFIVPGFSLHDELGNFVEAGFTPMEALQTATSNPAKFFGIEDSAGSIAVGKVADLVLLRANPLDDIHNTRKIVAVIANGHYFDRKSLDTLLSHIEQAAKHQ